MELNNSKDFIRRHIGPSDEQIESMLKFLKLNSLNALIDKVVPKKISF